jgi:Rps23 Pro-64 3,4-dihydroxylase Tpa1-like proline 4-hydroxylase
VRRHDDLHSEEGRLVAYVINLTPAWNADFGGMLHFIGDDGSVEETFYPWFNSLSLFRVPQLHFVSYVPPYVTADRYGITGWFRT